MQLYHTYTCTYVYSSPENDRQFFLQDVKSMILTPYLPGFQLVYLFEGCYRKSYVHIWYIYVYMYIYISIYMYIYIYTHIHIDYSMLKGLYVWFNRMTAWSKSRFPFTPVAETRRTSSPRGNPRCSGVPSTSGEAAGGVSPISPVKCGVFQTGDVWFYRQNARESC